MEIKQLETSQKEKILSELTERFGFPRKTESFSGPNQTLFGLGDRKVFDNFKFYKLKDTVYVCSHGVIELAKNISGVQDLGFAFARLGANVKITTNVVQMIGRFAKKNFVEISEKEAKQFIAGKDFELNKEQIANATNGFVIVRFGADNLGVGFLRDKNLKNLLPGAKQLPTFNF